MNKTLANALLVFLAGSSYGFIVPAVKTAMAIDVFPIDFLPLQYLVAVPLCLSYTLFRHVKFGSPLSCAKLAILGVFTGCTSICYYTSVSLLPGAVALTLLFQYVWVNVLIECVVERRLPERSTAVAVAIVLVGTLFAAGVFEGTIGTLDPVGIALGAGSAVFYALFLFFSGRVGVDQPAPLRATMLACGGLAVTSFANPACYTTAFFDPMTWPFAIGFSLLGVIVPTVMAILFFGETPRILQVIGIVLTLLAIVFMQGKGDKAGSLAGLIGLLLCGGLADAMSKIYAQYGAPALSNHYLMYTFFVALVLCALLCVKRGERLTLRDALCGVAVGVPNYFSARFLLL